MSLFVDTKSDSPAGAIPGLHSAPSCKLKTNPKSQLSIKPTIKKQGAICGCGAGLIDSKHTKVLI
ncbi:hypothetical protein [Rheinheimera sp.]|uniref:hypothetical protein n=1 Tax=Rheinheimera sp. TaxID=1869214 RepID=UPI0027B9CD69|nr:hypothetical protein [Rheinheimera sp.]